MDERAQQAREIMSLGVTQLVNQIQGAWEDSSSGGGVSDAWLAAMGEAVAADVDRAVRSRRNPGRIRSRCPWRLARRPGRPR